MSATTTQAQNVGILGVEVPDKWSLLAFCAWIPQNSEFAEAPIQQVTFNHTGMHEFVILSCEVLPTPTKSATMLWLRIERRPTHKGLAVLLNKPTTTDIVQVSATANALYEPCSSPTLFIYTPSDHPAQVLKLKHILEMYECIIQHPRKLPVLGANYRWPCVALFECLNGCAQCYEGDWIGWRPKWPAVDVQAALEVKNIYQRRKHPHCCGRLLSPFPTGIFAAMRVRGTRPLQRGLGSPTNGCDSPGSTTSDLPYYTAPSSPFLRPLTSDSLFGSQRPFSPIPLSPTHPILDTQSARSFSSAYLSSDEMLQRLVDHGCVDLTSQIDFTRFSQIPLAGGAYGDVWKGNLKDGTEVAVKVWRLRLILMDGPKSSKRAMREIFHWSKAKHRNIQELMGVILFQDRLGMVSRWRNHGNLQEYIVKHPGCNRYLLCVQVASGIAYLHSPDVNMVHGDIKAANVLVSADGVAKLSDFDHSIMLECSLNFSETSSKGGGTIRWMVGASVYDLNLVSYQLNVWVKAPELINDEGGSCRRNTNTDVYALGMTMLEIITGTPPYSQEYKSETQVIKIIMQGKLPARQAEHFGENPREERMWALLQHCWNYDPILRPTAAEVLEDMQSILSMPLVAPLRAH